MNPLPLTIEHALLGFLHQQPLHGYELYRRLIDPAGIWLIWRIKQSQLYALLTKLETEGYVVATRQLQDSRPPRKIFQLTEHGQETYRTWVQSPVAHGRLMRQEFLAKLYFAQQEGPELVRQLLERQRTLCQEWLATQQMQGKHQQPPSFSGLVRQFRISQIEATLAWLSTCEQNLALTTTTA
jgi:PadR family transcriptional regulator, regulatory protein AphA